MACCFVPSCPNTYIVSPEKFFFALPVNHLRRLQWCEAVGAQINLASHSKFCCEDHFNLQEDVVNYEYALYVRSLGHRPRLTLKADVIPQIFPRQQTNETFCSTSQKEKNAVPMDVDPQNSEINRSSPRDEQTAHFSNMYTSCCNKLTRLSMSSMNVVSVEPVQVSKNSTNKRPRFEVVAQLSQQSSSTSGSSKPPESQGSSSDQDFKTSYNFEQYYKYSSFVMKHNARCYLGLNDENMRLVSVLAESTGLSEDDIMIVLRKVRLYESNEKLGHTFNKHKSTISRIIHHCLPILACHLKQFIYWPDRDVILANLPLTFRTNFSKVQCIIDCYEVQIEKPSDPALQAECWSNYKNCHTLKYLIACTPDGFISFASEGFGGRKSDQDIIKKSNFLDNLQPNTMIMADRGFKHIDYEVMLRNCELVRPPSVSNADGTVMTKDEVRLTKTIASLRGHVERVIKRIRDFAFLKPHATVQHDLLLLIDYFVVIACALVNFSTPIFR